MNCPIGGLHRHIVCCSEHAHAGLGGNNHSEGVYGGHVTWIVQSEAGEHAHAGLTITMPLKYIDPWGLLTPTWLTVTWPNHKPITGLYLHIFPLVIHDNDVIPMSRYDMDTLLHIPLLLTNNEQFTVQAERNRQNTAVRGSLYHTAVENLWYWHVALNMLSCIRCDNFIARLIKWLSLPSRHNAS